MVAVGGVLVLVFLGSTGFRHLDHALLGYLGAVLAATFGIAYRTSAFWRRPASAVYGRALLRALRDPRRLRAALAGAGRHVIGQEMIARRSRGRWLAHLLLSLGTLASFAITLPLVFGWLHFVVVDDRTYQVVFFGLPLPGHQFAIDGAVGFFMFHALGLCGVAVALGAASFLVARWRRRGEPGATSGFHVAPLLLLAAVALTGLALPASRAVPGAFHVASLLHELTVVVLLVALPFSKLNHLFIRPLQVGALVMRAAGEPRRTCVSCGADLAPAAQAAAVAGLLAERGFAFARHVEHCPPCRRRLVAAAQARMLDADFQPPLTGVRPAPPTRAEAA
ncbi:hypothetical protein KF840_09850 [bacterium]|nr:hypothetical protein [bacterium]